MWFGSLLAWPSDSGVAGGAIVGAAAYVHSHVLAASRHRERTAQAERQHLESRADARAHHNELKQLVERHHQQQVARLEDHADAVKAHVTATLRPPAARRSPKGTP